MLSKLEESFLLAYDGHEGQVDKQGEPYIMHLFRVASAVPEEIMHLALLHDYFEDVYVPESLDDLAERVPFLSMDDCQTLWPLTRKPGQEYFHYIEEIKMSFDETARTIKLVDLRDNLSRKGIPDSLVSRYHKAIDMLLYVF